MYKTKAYQNKDTISCEGARDWTLISKKPWSQNLKLTLHIFKLMIKNRKKGFKCIKSYFFKLTPDITWKPKIYTKPEIAKLGHFRKLGIICCEKGR